MKLEEGTMIFDTCIFDFYGTLADIRTDETAAEVWIKMSQFYALYGACYTPSEMREKYEQTAQAMTEGIRGIRRDSHESFPEIQIEKVFEELFNAKGIHAENGLVIHVAQFFRVLTTKYLKLYEGTEDMLHSVKKAGKKIYLLSNAQRIFTEYEMNSLNITDYFDGIFISSDFEFKKPDIRFFRKLLDTYHILPESAIMIGNDGICDVSGAKKAGLRTLYVHSNISPDEETPNADYVLDQMDMERIKEILLDNK